MKPTDFRTCLLTPTDRRANTSWLLTALLVLVPVLVPSLVLAAESFDCDIENWDLQVDSAFGAAVDETRGFATVQAQIPLGCLVEGWSKVDGIIVYTTRSASGGSTLPLRPEVRYSAQNGPPSNQVLTSGPVGTVEGVPQFPAYARSSFPVDSEAILMDIERDGIIDNFVAGIAFLDGGDTVDRFVVYSRSGASLPCFTGTEGMPLDSPCSAGDPLFRQMGIGIQLSASRATVGGQDGYCPIDVRTNNPAVKGGGSFQLELQPAISGPCNPPTNLDQGRLLGPDGQVIATVDNPEYHVPYQLDITPEQVQFWNDIKMFFEITHDTVIDKKPLTPAQALFLDGFETGDLSEWGSIFPP